MSLKRINYANLAKPGAVGTIQSSLLFQVNNLEEVTDIYPLKKSQ